MRLTAPFTPEQVEALNLYQRDGRMHPFTCGNSQCRAVLTATEAGWICNECHSYTQDWAHDFMADRRGMRQPFGERPDPPKVQGK